MELLQSPKINIIYPSPPFPETILEEILRIYESQPKHFYPPNLVYTDCTVEEFINKN